MVVSVKINDTGSKFEMVSEKKHTMTYHQKFEELRADFHLKGERLINAEKSLSSILGWGDSDELNEFLNAKAEFDEASRTYHDFISIVKDKSILPETEYR